LSAQRRAPRKGKKKEKGGPDPERRPLKRNFPRKGDSPTILRGGGVTEEKGFETGGKQKWAGEGVQVQGHKKTNQMNRVGGHLRKHTILLGRLLMGGRGISETRRSMRK